MSLIKLKCACHFFLDNDDIFSHYVSLCVILCPFVIDTTQVPGDLLHKKLSNFAEANPEQGIPDSNAISRYIQDAHVCTT